MNRPTFGPGFSVQLFPGSHFWQMWDQNGNARAYLAPKTSSLTVSIGMSSLFKKIKKSLKPSKKPLSLGIPTQNAIGALGIDADLDPNVASGDEGSTGGSEIVVRGSSETQRSIAPGPSAQGPRHDDVTPLGRENEQDIFSNVPTDEPGPAASDVPSITTREPGAQDERGREDQETLTENPSETPVRAAVGGDHVVNGASDAVRPGSSSVADGGGEDRPAGGPVNEDATHGFGHLKALLSVVSTDFKEPTGISNRAENLHSKTTLLEKQFDTLPGDVIEQGRRAEVLRKFKAIEIQLQQLLSQKPQPQQPPNTAKNHEAVSGLLEDLREVTFDYKMSRQSEIYEEGCKTMEEAEITALNNFRCAQGAEYEHGGRKGCLKGTRVEILDAIELWAGDFGKLPVYWLNGLAGTGKSAIAQTIAERLFADGQLGASFFCSRDFEDRSNLQLIFPTLAVQLARKYPKFRSAFVPLIQSNPGVAHGSLCNQLDKLIVKPLEKSGVSAVIVIDALDECKDEEPASAILSVLGRFVLQLPQVKFFLTGRPEPRIREGFRLPLLVEKTDIFVLHEVGLNQVSNDIQQFFKSSFLELAFRKGGLAGWPTQAQLDLLCVRVQFL